MHSQDVLNGMLFVEGEGVVEEVVGRDVVFWKYHFWKSILRWEEVNRRWHVWFDRCNSKECSKR